MGVIEADALQDIIETAANWPIWSADGMGGTAATSSNIYAQAGQYGDSLRDLALWVALRESDRERLKQLINWERDREYRVDPLADRIAEAYRDLIFGEDPEFRAAAKEDQDNMDEMVKANDLPSELRRWSGDCVSEGEIWWRIYTDPDVSEWPIVDGVSRLNTVPYFIGRRIGAVAFVEDILSQQIKLENAPELVVWRHIEIQTDGLVRNLLYRGGVNNIGDRVPLAQSPATAHLEDEWDHGLKVMLAGRIPNKLGRDFRLGISEYKGIRDQLLDLNEARTIMAENARLTSQSRMIIPASQLDEEGKFDASKNVVVAETMDDSLDNTGKNGPYAVLEYNFQATPLLDHIQELMLTALTRVGLSEQFVGGGKSAGGQAWTGTALRTRLIPTNLAASGKGRYYDGEVPKMLQAMQLVSNLPKEKNGTGQSWNKPDEAPVMIRTSVLPEDQNEKTQRLVMAVQGETMSIETAVTEGHPEWEEDEVKDEVLRIRLDRSVGATFGSGDETDLEAELTELPSAPEGGPGSAVDTPGSLGGARQPGVTGGSQGPDGQTPGKRPPVVKAGGPK